jgi:hypothetical protein
VDCSSSIIKLPVVVKAMGVAAAAAAAATNKNTKLIYGTQK